MPRVAAGARPLADYRSQVFADGPSRYWRLDELSGGTAIDSSGGRDNGANNNATTGNPGPLGDGSTSYGFNGSITVVYGQTLIVPTLTTAMEIWFKSGVGYASGGGLIDLGPFNAVNVPNNCQLVMLNTGQINWQVEQGDGGRVNATSPLTYNDGLWHHAVGVVSGAALALYIDGRLVATAATNGTILGAAQTWWLHVGADGSTSLPSAMSFQVFTGNLAQAAMYLTALSLQQVLAHYQAGLRAA